MYTIKGAAERVGITPSNLRAWERRYRIVAPGRTEGGYRIYSEDDVRVLALMARLIDEGRTPSLAAREIRQQHQDAAPTVGRPPHEAPSDDAAAPPCVDAVITAAMTLDARSLTMGLDDMFARGSFESVVDTVLLPMLDALGEAWESGQISVAGEHLVANAVMRRLGAAYEAAGVGATGPRILIGMAPGARHELGLYSFAVAARRRGLATDYLGADLPVTDWLRAAAGPHLSAVVLAIPTQNDVAPTADVIRALRANRPDLLIAVGGREQDRTPEGTVRLGHRVAAAAHGLAELTSTKRRPSQPPR